jgi:hypothetical protein
MDNLTILNYTSNAMPEKSHRNFQLELLKVIGDTPLISVSQKPMDFGQNICVGEIGKSYYNLYYQQLIGLREVKTKWVAFAEDDSLYTTEHFSYRPPDETTVSYNKNFWFLDTANFWTKGHIGTFGAISATNYVLESLERRYERFPEEIMPRNSQRWFWMDFGFDDRLGLKKCNTEQFATEIPLITFAHYAGTYGKPHRRQRTSTQVDELPYWGNAKELRNKMEGK